MKKNKALVTGGAGFIGSNLVKQLLTEGYSVNVLDNFSTGYRTNLDLLSPLSIFDGDVRDQKIVEKAIKNADVIFHLAASVGNKRSIDSPITDAEINVLGTLNVLEAAKKEGIKKIVTSSSAGIFGELKTIPIKEDHPVEPDTPYGCTKLCEEKLCLSYAKLYGIEAICLRYFNVYGQNQRFDAYGNVIPIFVHRMLRDEPLIIFGDGEQTRDFVHVSDVVQANIKAAEACGINGAFNIASGESITINRLVEIIVKGRADTVRIEYAPKRKGDVHDSLADITLAGREFNYSPEMDLEKGIEEYIVWAEKNSTTDNKQTVNR